MIDQHGVGILRFCNIVGGIVVCLVRELLLRLQQAFRGGAVSGLVWVTGNRSRQESDTTETVKRPQEVIVSNRAHVESESQAMCGTGLGLVARSGDRLTGSSSQQKAHRLIQQTSY